MEALSHEVAGFGIKVSIVEPAVFKTGLRHRNLCVFPLLLMLMMKHERGSMRALHLSQ